MHLNEILVHLGDVVGTYTYDESQFPVASREWALDVCRNIESNVGERVAGPTDFPLEYSFGHRIYPDPIRGTIGLATWRPHEHEPLWVGYLVLRLEPGQALRASKSLDLALGGHGSTAFARVMEEGGVPLLIGGYVPASHEGRGLIVKTEATISSVAISCLALAILEVS